MKQRIRVIGIIQTERGFLLLKRAQGRAAEAPCWELPTGKIQFGEQPEEAMSRAIFEYLETQVEEITLVDAVTFSGMTTASQLANLYIVYEIKLAKTEVRLAPTERYLAFKYAKEAEILGLRLEEATLAVWEIEKGRLGENDFGVEEHKLSKDNPRETAHAATVFVDGASRGNPGPSGVGYYIVDENGQVLKQGGEFIGFATSRVAEYYALKEGVEQALELGLKRVRFVSDNLMLINQMKGIYQVKNQDLELIYQDVWRLLAGFEAVSFMHQKRERNQEADNLATRAVLEYFKKKS